MISLGGIILAEDMILTNRYQTGALTGSFRRTKGGRLIVQDYPLIAGVALNLESGPDYGWITLATLRQIQTLDRPGNRMVLVYHNELFLVRFRVTEPPYLDFLPVLEATDPLDDDPFSGVAKLITVA